MTEPRQCDLCEREVVREDATFCAEHDAEWKRFQRAVEETLGSTVGATDAYRPLVRRRDEH
jgi:hypothetical protein